MYVGQLKFAEEKQLVILKVSRTIKISHVMLYRTPLYLFTAANNVLSSNGSPSPQA